MVLCQEHKLFGQALADFEVWCRSRGWKVVACQAKAGKGHGASGGTAVIVRQWIGVLPNDMMVSEQFDNRLAFAEIEIPD